MTLSQVTKKILIRDPFYGFVLMSLNKYFKDSVVPTAGVTLNGINYEMIVNSVFWNSLTDEQQIEVTKHELLHICFFHLLEADNYEDHELANIAADAEVNQYLNLKILNSVPGGCIDIIKEFPGIKEKAGVKYYYDFLKQQQQQNGGSGNSFSKVVNHDTWTPGTEELSDAVKELVKNQVNSILVQAAEAVEKSQGTIPAEFQEYIENLRKKRPPVFDWKGYLRRLLGTSTEYYIKNTRKRPSKRFKDAMGAKHKYKAKLLVAVDTSGSVNGKELTDFFTEIDHIYKSGSTIEVVECDSSIKRVYKYTGHFDGKVTGRGGTSYNPVVEYFNQRRNEYTALVYFTDGYCSLDFKLLGPSVWVITSDGMRQDYPGKTVYIPKTNE